MRIFSSILAKENEEGENGFKYKQKFNKSFIISREISYQYLPKTYKIFVQL